MFGTVARGSAEEKERVGEVAMEPVRESTREPAKEPVRPASATAPVLATEPPATAASGGFTQLLRALNYDQVRDQVKKETARTESPLATNLPVSVVGLQPMGMPQEGKAMPERAAAAPVASSQVTSFLPQEPGGASIAPGSFTQMFQRLEMEPAKEDAAARTTVTAPSEPGSFTQLFEPPEQPRESVPEAKVVPTPVEAGSFTRLFSGIEAGEQSDLGKEPPRQPAEPQRAYQPEAVVASAPVAKESEQAVSPAANAPDSFTQMFQALGEAPQTAPVPEESREGPGSFTRLFAGMPASPPVEATPRFDERMHPASAPEQGSGGASQVFSTFRTPPAEPRAAPGPEARVDRGPVFSPDEPSRMGSSPVTGTSSSGGLTQLLRTLDQPVKSGQPYLPPPPVPTGGAQAGSFTGVYGELDAATTPPPARPPTVSGPSEFTRLINASALREAGLRGGGAAAPAHAAPGAASSSAPLPGMGSFSVTPPTLPGVGGASFSTPHLPGGASASVSTPVLHAPQIPQVRLPGAPTITATPAARLQKFVPLLLILVIFLLAAILVAVVVLMKK